MTSVKVSDYSIETLKRYHPQLTEKAVLDLVNGLEVAGDHLRCRNTPKPVVARLWNALTGKSSREQYLIDVNLKTGLETVKTWLTDVQAFQAKSDLALWGVREKLTETRTYLGGRVNKVSLEINRVREEVGSQLENITSRIGELELRSKAKIHLDLLLSSVQKHDKRQLPLLARVFTTVDELWWGDFGNYCRQSSDDQTPGDLLALASNNIAESFSSHLGFRPHTIFSMEELIAPFFKLSETDGELMAYLSDYGSSDITPLMKGIARASEGVRQISESRDFPLALSFYGLTDRLVRETRRATSKIEKHNGKDIR